MTPSRIGGGLGKELFGHAVREARARGAVELLIESDPNAEGFDLWMGARRVGEAESGVTGADRVAPLLSYPPREERVTVALTAAQGGALRRLVRLLDGAGACYQFTGGFAGNLHGSRWPLHDFDLDVGRDDLPRVAEALRPHTTRPLGPYSDHEFELRLLRAGVDGVGVDVSQAEEAFAVAVAGGRRVPPNTSLARRERVAVFDLDVWVQPLDELIAYKELLGRSADVADLRSLSSRRPV